MYALVIMAIMLAQLTLAQHAIMDARHAVQQIYV